MELKPPPVALLNPYTGADIHVLYTSEVTVDGGAAGHARSSGRIKSDDGNLDVELRLPKELGGPGGGTNPEQLFAAGFAACFHGALRLNGMKLNVDTSSAEITSSVQFGRDPEDGLFLITANLNVSIPGIDRAIAERLVEETEKVCPYSKMARQGIIHSVNVI